MLIRCLFLTSWKGSTAESSYAYHLPPYWGPRKSLFEPRGDSERWDPMSPGLGEHATVMWESIKMAKAGKSELHVVWLDVANAHE